MLDRVILVTIHKCGVSSIELVVQVHQDRGAAAAFPVPYVAVDMRLQARSRRVPRQEPLVVDVVFPDINELTDPYRVRLQMARHVAGQCSVVHAHAVVAHIIVMSNSA